MIHTLQRNEDAILHVQDTHTHTLKFQLRWSNSAGILNCKANVSASMPKVWLQYDWMEKTWSNPRFNRAFFLLWHAIRMKNSPVQRLAAFLATEAAFAMKHNVVCTPHSSTYILLSTWQDHCLCTFEVPLPALCVDFQHSSTVATIPLDSPTLLHHSIQT